LSYLYDLNSRIRLTLKPDQRLGFFGCFVGKELQGDESVQGYIFSLVDDTHPAPAQLLDDAVVRDGLADQMKKARSVRDPIRRPNCGESMNYGQS
jgi:hypothetical protein